MSDTEKKRIRKKYTNIALGLLALIAIYIIVSAVVIKKLTFVYDIVIVVGLLTFWAIMDILIPIKAHEFEGKTPEQMAAYKKYAILDLIGYIGLMVFALALHSGAGIYGALVYVVARIMKNRFWDEYEGITKEEEAETAEPAETVETAESAEIPDTAEIGKTAEITETAESTETAETGEASEQIVAGAGNDTIAEPAADDWKGIEQFPEPPIDSGAGNDKITGQ